MFEAQIAQQQSAGRKWYVYVGLKIKDGRYRTAYLCSDGAWRQSTAGPDGFVGLYDSEEAAQDAYAKWFDKLEHYTIRITNYRGPGDYDVTGVRVR